MGAGLKLGRCTCMERMHMCLCVCVASLSGQAWPLVFKTESSSRATAGVGAVSGDICFS